MAIAVVILLLLLEALFKRLKGARPMAPRVLNSEDYLAMADVHATIQHKCPRF